jgi:hypothetical protein
VPVQINGQTIREALWGEESYVLLFALLLVDYLIVTLDTSVRWGSLARSITISVTVLFAIHTSGGSRALLRFAQFGVVIALIGSVALTGWDNHRLAAVSYLVVTVLLVITPVVILKKVLPKDEVDIETIFAAIDVYILLGLVFATLFIGLAKLMTSPPFLAQPGHHSTADYVYLSFVTLTTVGFGDLTPLSKLARSIVVLEALIGQIFLVVLVARLVSAYNSQATQKILTRTTSTSPRRRRRRNQATATDDEVGLDPEAVEAGTGPDEPGESGPAKETADARTSADEDRSGPSQPQ